MSTSRSFKCVNSPNSFCYVCGLFLSVESRRIMNDELRKTYFDYFGLHVNQDKQWVPHFLCAMCRSSLLTIRWKNNEGHLNFGVPMIWREPVNHQTDCYFCLNNVRGMNMKNRHLVQYVNAQSITKPQMHSDTLPIPTPPNQNSSLQSPELASVSSSGPSNPSSGEMYACNTHEPKLFNQADLNDFVRDLELSKSKSELCASRLKDRNLLAKG